MKLPDFDVASWVIVLLAVSNDPNIPSWGWWVGRTNMNMRYWGGSSPGSGMCKCALKSECRNVEEACNCDAGPHCTQYLRVSDMIMCTVYSACAWTMPDSAMRIKLCAFHCFSAGLSQNDVFDDGFLRHKEHLPVIELRFGDTGSLTDQKWGQHELGPLRCYEDSTYLPSCCFASIGALCRLACRAARDSDGGVLMRSRSSL